MAKKILIVEDEPHLRLLLQQTLEDLEDDGVTLLVVDNGADALRVARAEHPCVIFLDVMLPEVDGFTVCRTIKQEWGVEGVYIVLLTAKGQAIDRQQGLAVGADDYLTKPFDPDKLYQLAQAQVYATAP